MVDSGEYSTSCQIIQTGTCIPPGDKDTFLGFPIIILPLYSDTMSRVFTTDSCKCWQSFGANMIQPNQANSSNGMTLHHFGAKVFGQYLLHNLRSNPVVQQYPPSDYALDGWDFHLVIEAKSEN